MAKISGRMVQTLEWPRRGVVERHERNARAELNERPAEATKSPPPSTHETRSCPWRCSVVRGGRWQAGAVRSSEVWSQRGTGQYNDRQESFVYTTTTRGVAPGIGRIDSQEWITVNGRWNGVVQCGEA